MYIYVYIFFGPNSWSPYQHVTIASLAKTLVMQYTPSTPCFFCTSELTSTACALYYISSSTISGIVPQLHSVHSPKRFTLGKSALNEPRGLFFVMFSVIIIIFVTWILESTS